ncbi:hypothetical protein FQT06_07150 [Enterococcus hirae]|nr:hypothetical protein [Enterococcus hirae]
MKMNYRKSLFITLLSVSVLGTATNANVFAEQQSEKANVTQSTKESAEKTATPAQQPAKVVKQNVTITLDPYVVGRSQTITGSYDGTNAVYMRAEVNGKKETLVSSKGLASGKISYYVGNLQSTDNVDIVLFDKDYKEIGRQKVTITEPVKTQITLDPYVVGRSLNITGSYNGTNAVYMRAEVNGQKQGLVSSKALASGKISYYVGNLKATDKAEIVLFDKNYQEIGRQKVTFTEPVKTVISLDKYVVGTSSTITGTYNGTNAVYMQAIVNGKKESFIPSKELAKGKINYYIGKLNTGDKAEIVLYDKDYQELGRQQVTIDGPAQVSMTLDKYIIGRSTNVTGTYNGTDAVYMRAEVNGKKEGLVKSKELASGKINYYVGSLKENDKAEIVLFDKNYQEIGRQAVPFSVKQVFYLAGLHLNNLSSDDRISVTAENQKVVIAEVLPPGTTARVHSRFGNNFYFSIGIKDPQGQWITKLNWKGNDWTSHGHVGTYDVPNGSTVQISHKEGYTRFTTNDNDALRNKTGITYTYKMIDNRLVLESVSPDYLL